MLIFQGFLGSVARIYYQFTTFENYINSLHTIGKMNNIDNKKGYRSCVYGVLFYISAIGNTMAFFMLIFRKINY